MAVCRYVSPLACFGVLLCLFGGTGQVQASDSVLLTSTSSSASLPGDYPLTNLRISLRIKYSKPGTILDTVGMNAAPSGSFTLSIGGDGKPVFQVFVPEKESSARTPSGWHILAADTVIPADTDCKIGIDVLENEIKLSVNGKVAKSVALAMQLSGKTIYIGDNPEDDSWGDKYNIHPAMIGEVQLLHFGAVPKDAPSTAAPIAAADTETKPATVTDETGTMTAEQRSRLQAELQTLREKHDLIAAVVFINPATQPEAQARADEYQRTLSASGILPARYAIFLYAGETRIYKRSPDFDATAKLDTVKKAWGTTTAQDALPDRVAVFLGAMNRALDSGGTPTAATPSPPVATNPPTPATPTPGIPPADAAAVDAGTAKVVDAFLSGKVEQVVALILPTTRKQLGAVLQAHPEALALTAKLLATRKLIALEGNHAEYQVTDRSGSYIVIFERLEGAWMLADL